LARPLQPSVRPGYPKTIGGKPPMPPRFSSFHVLLWVPLAACPPVLRRHQCHPPTMLVRFSGWSSVWARDLVGIPGDPPVQGVAMNAYSLDLRERVLADCDAGLGTGAVAARYRVSASWVRRLKRRRRETGSIAPTAQRHGPPPRWAEHAERIAEAV